MVPSLVGVSYLSRSWYYALHGLDCLTLLALAPQVGFRYACRDAISVANPHPVRDRVQREDTDAPANGVDVGLSQRRFGVGQGGPAGTRASAALRPGAEEDDQAAGEGGLRTDVEVRIQVLHVRGS